jgi:hypothetical protein
MGRQSGYNLSRLHRRSLVMHRRPGIHTISAGLSSVASSRLLTQTRRRADGESPIRPQRGLADAPRHICYDTLASKSRRYRDYTPKRQFGPSNRWCVVATTGTSAIPLSMTTISSESLSGTYSSRWGTRSRPSSPPSGSCNPGAFSDVVPD